MHGGVLRILRAMVVMAALAAGPVAAEAEEASLNLRNVDIRALIDTIAEVTGKNFLVDPRVKGEVTVVSSKSMSPHEIYQVFLSILEVHGFTAVPSGKVIKIVPDASVRLGTMEGDDRSLELSGIPDDEVVTRVIQVRHVDAGRLVPVLRPLMPQQAHLGAYPSANTLVLSDRAANVERIAAIVDRIDRANDEGVEVIRLSHAEADELVKIITQFYNVPKDSGGGVVLAADPRSNSILLAADPDRRLRIRSLVAHLDTPLDVEGETQIVFLRNTSAGEMAEVLQKLAQVTGEEGEGTQADREKRIDIQAHEANNALVLTAPPQEMQNLKSVIRQLDIQRAQILVEAIIAEVSTDLTQELGAQFVIANLEGSTAPLGFTNFGSNRLTDLAAAAEGGGQLPSFGAGAFLGVGKVGAGGTNWAVLISALSGDAASNILSTPTLLATDNEEAEIVVGQNVPFVTGQFTNTAGNATNAVNPFQTIERRDIGITLRVKPQINEGDRVRMVIEQEVSSLAPTAISTSDVVTNKRSIKTTATVRDGQVIVLGGLIEDRFSDTQQRVPVLGSMPVLGPLFRYENTQKVKQNLMVFLRPIIVSDPELGSSFSGQKYGYLRERQRESRIRERGLLNLKGSAPELPEQLDDLFERGVGAAAATPPETAEAGGSPAPEASRRPAESLMEW